MITISKDEVREPLYVVVPVQNPWRWKSRYKHTDRAIKHFMDSGAVVILVETAFNRREFVYADSGLDGTPANCRIHGSEFKHQYVPLRSASELWLKENMINVGVERIPNHDWNQVAWYDSDVTHGRPNWVGAVIHSLQHHAFVQPFSQARDFSPNFELLPEDYPHSNGVSFVRSWKDGDLEESLTSGWKAKKPNPVIAALEKVQADVALLTKDLTTLAQDLEGEYPYGGRRVFPGLAWACTRKAWDDVGGLPDFAVWGGCDWSMSHALVGRRQGMMHTGLHANYKSMMNAWADRADRYVRRNVGVVEGVIFHSWHGKKTVRGYGDKHRILARVGFDPHIHLKREASGLLNLNDDGSDAYIELRDQFRKVAKERNEDGNEI